jgi:sulfur-oxidizing protein SoxX
MQPVTAADLAVIKASFRESGQAKLDRLDQDEAQKLCSNPPSVRVPAEAVARIEKINMAAIKYPADGRLMGDWKAGERIAQSGVGKQFSDDPKVPAGGNCFGKLRGGPTPEMQRYTYGRIYNSQAFSACSNMPRFGHNDILTEQQLKDVTALLLDPNSPVNQ